MDVDSGISFTPADENWVMVNGVLRKQFTNYLRYEVKPLTYRKYDAEKGKWLFYYTKLPLIAKVAKKIYGHVDWSELPTAWQMLAAGASTVDEVIIATSSPYQKLHLLDTAPLEVVKSVYKTLSRINHPDHGGDADEMVALNAAYEEILSSHSD